MMHTASAAPRRRPPDLAIGAALFLMVFALYFVSYTRFLPAAADEMLYFGLAESIAKAHVVSIDQVSTVGPAPEEFGVGGHRYSKKGPLHSLLAVPLLLLAQRLPIGAVDTALLLNYIVGALVVVLLFLLVRRLGYSRAVALALSVTLAFSTPLWVYAKSFFSEPTITLCVLATLYAAYAAADTGRARWLVVTGVAFGLAVAAKNVNALLLVPVPLYLAWASWRGSPLTTRTQARSGVDDLPRSMEGLNASAGRSAAAVFWFALGVAPLAALLMLYSYMRYGTPFSSGYGEWETFSTPVWEGIAGILISPGKSIAVYTPLFLLLPFWTPSFFRRFQSFSTLVLAVVVLHLVLYGSWYVWWGAWGWGSRFTLPILPLLALLLAEGFAARHRPATWGLVAAFGVLGVVVQVLGVAVHYDVYLSQLLVLDPRPDTLTIYDLARSPILNQVPLLSRQWLDFAWIEPVGPDAVNTRALALALIGAAVGLACLGVAARTVRRAVWAPALGVSALVVAGATFADLHAYYRQGDAAIMAVGGAFERAPADTAALHMIPSAVVPYSNWQKRPLAELGWSEELNASEIILSRVQEFAQRYSQLWVVTEAPAKAQSNGVEAALNRSLVEIGGEQIGPYRLLRYATSPASLPLASVSHRFGEGITLAGFAVDGVATAGKTLDLTLKWQATGIAAGRPEYMVFVHLVGPDGTLIAQHDGPPASGLIPTAKWTDGQVVYDHHAVPVPAGAPAGLHLVRIGLYELASGKRASVLDASGSASGDTVTLDLNAATHP